MFAFTLTLQSSYYVQTVKISINSVSPVMTMNSSFKQMSMRCSSVFLRQLVRSNHNDSAHVAKKTTKAARPLYLDPHKWIGLPADRIFELHNTRVANLGEEYYPTNGEKRAVLSTLAALKKGRPTLSYTYDIDNFNERIMNNEPQSKQAKLSNIEVYSKGETPHKMRLIDQTNSVIAFEMPLLAKYRQPYVPPTKERRPLRLTFQTDFSDTPNEFNSKVTLTAKLDDLKLTGAVAKKFMLLSGEKFNHNNRTLRFSSKKFPESTQNARWLSETLNKLLEESEDLTKNQFEEVPLNTSQTIPPKPVYKFPESWKRPEDASTQRHHVVQKFVRMYKNKKDKEYLNKISA